MERFMIALTAGLFAFLVSLLTLAVLALLSADVG